MKDVDKVKSLIDGKFTPLEKCINCGAFIGNAKPLGGCNK